MIRFGSSYFSFSDPEFNICREKKKYQDLVEEWSRICKYPWLTGVNDRQGSVRRDAPCVPDQSRGREECNGWVLEASCGAPSSSRIPKHKALGITQSCPSCKSFTASCTNAADKEMKPLPEHPSPAWWELQKRSKTVMLRWQAALRSNASGVFNIQGLAISQYSEWESWKSQYDEAGGTYFWVGQVMRVH